MKTNALRLRIILTFGLSALPLLTGCTTVYRSGNAMGDVTEAFNDISIDPNLSPARSGVVESVWEEPMVDVVEVPPGLDAEGVYYRPAHHEVVEVRQGRWQYYKQPKR